MNHDAQVLNVAKLGTATRIRQRRLDRFLDRLPPCLFEAFERTFESIFIVGELQQRLRHRQSAFLDRWINHDKMILEGQTLEG